MSEGPEFVFHRTRKSFMLATFPNAQPSWTGVRPTPPVPELTEEGERQMHASLRAISWHGPSVPNVAAVSREEQVRQKIARLHAYGSAPAPAEPVQRVRHGFDYELAEILDDPRLATDAEIRACTRDRSEQ
jgi:hypothetical protein